MIRQEDQTTAKLEDVRETARAKATAYIIPDYAARFPEQFEHAVEEIAAYEIRAMRKTPEN